MASAWRAYSPMAATAAVGLGGDGASTSPVATSRTCSSVTSTVYGGAVAREGGSRLPGRWPWPGSTHCSSIPAWPHGWDGSSAGLWGGRRCRCADSPPWWRPRRLSSVVASGRLRLLTSVPTAREIGTATPATAPLGSNVGGLFVTFEAGARRAGTEPAHRPGPLDRQARAGADHRGRGRPGRPHRDDRSTCRSSPSSRADTKQRPRHRVPAPGTPRWPCNERVSRMRSSRSDGRSRPRVTMVSARWRSSPPRLAILLLAALAAPSDSSAADGDSPTSSTAGLVRSREQLMRKALAVTLVAALLVSLLAVAASARTSTRVEDGQPGSRSVAILASLSPGEMTTVVVTLREQVDLAAVTGATRAVRLRHVIQALQTMANGSQVPTTCTSPRRAAQGKVARDHTAMDLQRDLGDRHRRRHPGAGDARLTSRASPPTTYRWSRPRSLRSRTCRRSTPRPSGISGTPGRAWSWPTSTAASTCTTRTLRAGGVAVPTAGTTRTASTPPPRPTSSGHGTATIGRDRRRRRRRHVDRHGSRSNLDCRQDLQ